MLTHGGAVAQDNEVDRVRDEDPVHAEHLCRKELRRVKTKEGPLRVRREACILAEEDDGGTESGQLSNLADKKEWCPLQQKDSGTRYE